MCSRDVHGVESVADLRRGARARRSRPNPSRAAKRRRCYHPPFPGASRAGAPQSPRFDKIGTRVVKPGDVRHGARPVPRHRSASRSAGATAIDQKNGRSSGGVPTGETLIGYAGVPRQLWIALHGPAVFPDRVDAYLLLVSLLQMVAYKVTMNGTAIRSR